MDQKEADYIIDQTANQTHNIYLKKTLQFLVPVSIISFLVSYFSIFNLLIFHPLQLYTSIIPILSQVLDRNCMFLICNGILAFLANNSSLMKHGGSMKSSNDDDDNLAFEGNAASLEYVVDHTQEKKEIKVHEEEDDDDGVYHNAAEEIEREEVRFEREEWGEEDDEVDDDDDEEIEVHVENSSLVSEMRVSTEELNKKFDEFIRKMKEEIRIEARQQYLIVV